MRKMRKRARAGAISATVAAKAFGRLVDRVRDERAVYIVERAGRPVAQIGPPPAAPCTLRDLAAWFRTRHEVAEAYLTAVEAGVARFNRPAIPEDRWAS